MTQLFYKDFGVSRDGVALGGLTGSLAHFLAIPGSEFEELNDAVGEVLGEVVGGSLDDIAIFAFFDDFRRAIGSCGERGKTTGERFQDDVGEGVVEGRKDEEVGCLVGLLDFPGGAFEVDMVDYAESSCQFPVGGRIIRADDAERAIMSLLACHREGAEDGVEAFAFEILTNEEKFDLKAFLIVRIGSELFVIDAIVDDVNAVLGVLVVFSDEGFRKLGVGDDDPGVIRIHDGAFDLENGTVPRIDRFDEAADLTGVAEFHPVALKGVGDSESVGWEIAGEGDDLIDFQILQCGLGIAIEGEVFCEGGCAVNLDRDVLEVGVDFRIEDFGENPDFVAHVAEFAAEIGRIPFCAPLAVGALAANHC